MQKKGLPSASFLEELRAFDTNARWAHQHPEALREHEWKFVAVDDQRVVAVADSEFQLRRSPAFRRGTYVTFVYPPDLAWVI